MASRRSTCHGARRKHIQARRSLRTRKMVPSVSTPEHTCPERPALSSAKRPDRRNYRNMAWPSQRLIPRQVICPGRCLYLLCPPHLILCTSDQTRWVVTPLRCSLCLDCRLVREGLKTFTLFTYSCLLTLLTPTPTLIFPNLIHSYLTEHLGNICDFFPSFIPSNIVVFYINPFFFFRYLSPSIFLALRYSLPFQSCHSLTLPPSGLTHNLLMIPQHPTRAPHH